MDDCEIVNMYLARLERAIEETDRKYGSAGRSIAMNILGNREDAEECVNDAYMVAWNTIPPQKPDPFRTYLFRIVRNRALAKYHFNTAKKRNSHYDMALEELEGCISTPFSVEEALEAKELSTILDRFLAIQDQKTRVIFVRRYWFGDPVALIAAKLSMKPNAVSVHLNRTRAKLRAFLRKEGYYV